MGRKIAIYTVLFGAYDEWTEPKYIQPDADHFVWTNQEIESKTYQIEKIATFEQTHVMYARKWKIYYGYNSLCAKGYDLIVYHDCSIVQTANFQHLIDLQICDFMVLQHPIRDCIRDEFHACCDGKRDDIDRMHKQVQRYFDDYYPEHNGLAATGVIFRRNTKAVLKFCKAWLKEVEKGSTRDQLSFNYVAWKMGYKFDFMDWQYLYDYFNYQNKHKKS